MGFLKGGVLFNSTGLYLGLIFGIGKELKKGVGIRVGGIGISNFGDEFGKGQFGTTHRKGIF